MKKLSAKPLAVVIAILVSFSAGQAISVAATCTTTLNSDDDIQAALDSATAGDVICLNPGIYSPSAKININTSITLQGPQAGVDPRPSAGTTRTPGDTATEAIIDGSASSLSGIIVIEADGVVLDGLEVRNGSGDLIDSETGTPTTGTILRYNIIRNSSGDEAVQLRACTGCVAEFNHVFDIAQDGINMCCSSTGGIIQYNEVHDSSSENAAIYIYESTNMAVQCNLVYNVFDNDGIQLGAKGGGDVAGPGGSVVGNVVHDTAQDGITVYTSDVVVEANEVYNSRSENGAVYLAYGISNINISQNNVHDNTLEVSKWGNPGAIMIGTDVDSATVHVNNNNITGNSPNGVTNKAVALLDATENWWGATDGPSGANSGSGDAVSSNVDFSPWLAEPAVIPDPCILDDDGSITIVKKVVAAVPGAPWSFSGTLGDFALPAAGGDDTFGGLVRGDYTITEITKADYTASAECTSGETGTSSVTVGLGPDEEVTCTFTNTFVPPVPATTTAGLLGLIAALGLVLLVSVYRSRRRTAV